MGTFRIKRAPQPVGAVFVGSKKFIPETEVARVLNILDALGVLPLFNQPEGSGSIMSDSERRIK